MKKKGNVVKYRKPFRINIGIIVFVFIFIYLVFNVFSYFTETHISVYEVEQGTIAANNIYVGLAVREEKVYSSEYTGSLNYYVKENSRVGYGSLLYSIDESGTIAERINQASQDASGISKKVSSEISEKIEHFRNTYQAQSYYNAYTFKDDINSVLNEALSLDALSSISEYAAEAEGNHTFHKVYAAEPGIIAYYADGYENVTTDNFNDSMFDKSAYDKANLKVRTEIAAGENAYKIIVSENWNIILPIPEGLAESLSNKDVIHIRFIKDAKEMYVNYTIRQKDGACYLILSLKNSMVRYASDRYLEIELLLAEENGLKIPNTAITEKEFYTIPKEYFLKGGDSDNDGLLVERFDDQGNRSTVFLSPTIYYENEDYCYIDSEYVKAGERLLKQDSGDFYVVGKDTATIKGVYNINKGYAVFKQIDVLYQNEEYTIVKTGTDYGISLYDHIALDGTKVKENELIK